MAAHPELPLKLHRTAVRTAAVAFWGLTAVAQASNYLGPGLQVNYLGEWVIAGLAFLGGFLCWFLPWERFPPERFLAVIVAGTGMLTVSVLFTGGVRSHLTSLFLVLVVFCASLAGWRTTAAIAALGAIGAAVPLVFQWDAFYARSLLMLVACMAIGAYLPSRVRRMLTDENRVAEERRSELEKTYLATIEALAAALDAKDRHTEAHSRETTALARAVGRRVGLADDRLRFLEYAALLHDIGKIGIPGYILNKPGPLDPEEMAIMREHPVIGERILASVPFLAPIRPIVRAEHERWDGEGYPDRLAGKDIPIEARIIHACDALQAMSSDRPYRPALPQRQRLEELRAQAGRQFDPEVVRALLAVIESGEVVIEGTDDVARHADRPEPAQAWTRHLDAIEQLGARLASITGVHEVCQSIGETIVTLLPYDQCRIYLLQDDGVTLRPAYFSDTQREEYASVTAESLALRLGEGITGWVAETRHGVMIGDTERHPKAMHVPGTGDSDESMLAVPVTFHDKLVGVFVTVKIGLHQYSSDHLRLLTILANQAAVSIANARLLESLAVSAMTDSLTGLRNRRAFEDKLRERLASSAEAFSVLMLDVDGLKRVNDAAGHRSGDAVLRRVADVLRANLREDDIVCRWGGDEFLILMPSVDRVGAVSLARRISGTLLTAVEGADPISVSIGTAAHPSDGATAEELLAAADREMYAEKRARAA
ncbi:MAG TPA: HD domain-containing phosphohydrolase [Candidatus Limnocylindrales bacterium]|nr:HD domain-containing phosphohydrolase [Candidatus Limnocylindrales bacterium]